MMKSNQKKEVNLQTFPKLMTEKYLKEPTEIERYVAYISDCEEWKIYFEASETKKQKEAEAATKSMDSYRLETLFADMGGHEDYFTHEFKAFLRGYLARGKEILKR